MKFYNSHHTKKEESANKEKSEPQKASIKNVLVYLKPYFTKDNAKKLLIYTFLMTVVSKGLVSLVSTFNINKLILGPLLPKINNQFSVRKIHDADSHVISNRFRFKSLSGHSDSRVATDNSKQSFLRRNGQLFQGHDGLPHEARIRNFQK